MEKNMESNIDEEMTEETGDQRQTFALKELRSCIAIDISGSTYGQILETEKQAISRISLLYNQTGPNLLNILSWNSRTSHPIPLPSHKHLLERLGASGGTVPYVLYSNAAYLKCLQDCSIWFLFTDGNISLDEVENFTGRTKVHGLHGTACAVVIFGKAVNDPGDLDISVGFSIYSQIPDSGLFFHDYLEDKLYILQTTGCFTNLLPHGMENPTLDGNTWADLPQIKYEDFNRLRIPTAQRIGKDEIRFTDGTVVNLDDLFADKVALPIRELIAFQKPHLDALVRKEGSGTRRDALNYFLDKQVVPTLSHGAERVDVLGRAQHSMVQLYAVLERGGPDMELRKHREELRSAHTANWAEFRRLKDPQVQEQNENIEAAREYSNDIAHSFVKKRLSEKQQKPEPLSARLSSGTRFEKSRPSRRRSASPELPDPVTGELHSRNTTSTRSHNTLPPTRKPMYPSSKSYPEECWIPGFVRGDDVEQSLSGRCMICDNVTYLAVLVRDTPIDQKTEATGEKVPDIDPDSYVVVDHGAMNIDSTPESQDKGKGKEKVLLSIKEGIGRMSSAMSFEMVDAEVDSDSYSDASMIEHPSPATGASRHTDFITASDIDEGDSVLYDAPKHASSPAIQHGDGHEEEEKASISRSSKKLHPLFCCEPCAHLITTTMKSTPFPENEKVIAAIPLVSMLEPANQKALKAVRKGVSGKFGIAEKMDLDELEQKDGDIMLQALGWLEKEWFKRDSRP